MIAARDAIEQAIVVSVGAAALTKERAESIVGELVGRGHLGKDEAVAMVGRIMARVRGEGPPSPAGLMGRLEDGAQSAFRELGLVARSDLEELRVRLAEIERRVGLLETTEGAPEAG